MLLHTLNRAPHSSGILADCLRVITPPAALLLIEDGVYAATLSNEPLFQSIDPAIDCYVLQADIDARGIGPLLSPRFTAISDSAFVTLSTQCERIQSWY